MFQLEIDEYYRTVIVGKVDEIGSTQCNELLEDYFDIELKDCEVTYSDANIMIDEMRDVEIRGMDCPVMHEIKIRRIN